MAHKDIRQYKLLQDGFCQFSSQFDILKQLFVEYYQQNNIFY